LCGEVTEEQAVSFYYDHL